MQIIRFAVINWPSPLFICCYGLNTITTLLCNYQSHSFVFNNADFFHYYKLSRCIVVVVFILQQRCNDEIGELP